MDEPTMRIGEVARRTGLSPGTIRAWQRRYGLLAPTRSEGGQRLYGRADVAALLEVAAHVDEGWAVSQAAAHVAARASAPTGYADAPVPDGADARAPQRPLPDRREQPRRSDGGSATTALLTPLDDLMEAADTEALAAAHRATRAMLRAASPAAVAAALADLVIDLGGELVPATLESDEVLPIDVGLGETEPSVVRAPSASVARLRLEAVLPSAIEDARLIVAGLRRAAVAGSPTLDHGRDDTPRPLPRGADAPSGGP